MVPSVATSTHSVQGSPVTGSNSAGGTNTLPSLPRVPTIRRVPERRQEAAVGGPQRAGIRVEQRQWSRERTVLRSRVLLRPPSHDVFLAHPHPKLTPRQKRRSGSVMVPSGTLQGGFMNRSRLAVALAGAVLIAACSARGGDDDSRRRRRRRRPTADGGNDGGASRRPTTTAAPTDDAAPTTAAPEATTTTAAPGVKFGTLDSPCGPGDATIAEGQNGGATLKLGTADRPRLRGVARSDHRDARRRRGLRRLVQRAGRHRRPTSSRSSTSTASCSRCRRRWSRRAPRPSRWSAAAGSSTTRCTRVSTSAR